MADAPRVTIPRFGLRPPGGGPGRFAPAARPRNGRQTFLRVFRLYRRWGKSVFAAGALTATASAIAVLIPYAVGRCFDAFRVDTGTVDGHLLGFLLLALAALHVTNWLITTLSGVLMLHVSQKLIFGLRTAFFAKMQKLPLVFYDTRPHGDTMSRLTNDVDSISSTIAQAATQIVSGALTLTGSLAVMLWLSLPLTLAVLVSVPLVGSLTRIIATRSRACFLAQQRSLGELNAVTEETIQGLKMVKAFGRRRDVMERFAAVNEELYESSRKAQTWSGFMMPLMNVINNLTFTLVAGIGGYLCVTAGLAVGTVVSFLSYSKQFAHPLNAVAGMFNTIQAALAGAERVFEILDQAEEAADAPDAVLLEHPAGRVDFEDVSFSYAPGAPVLQHVTFHVREGETVALVGETGAGKTTVVNLLTRFYDPDAGRILIDGTDIRNVARASLRNCFSIVLQDTCLFTGTIMDNIRYARTNATDREVIAAARLAHAHSFIEKLPRGYQTVVSGGTEILSQGQRQLLAISRAVLSDRPILILDEATSSVDTKTEKAIQRTLLDLMRSHTSFLIAHRLSTIRDADRIMVIGEGRILESGSHQELMALKGHYHDMVISQTGQE